MFSDPDYSFRSDPPAAHESRLRWKRDKATGWWEAGPYSIRLHDRRSWGRINERWWTLYHKGERLATAELLADLKDTAAWHAAGRWVVAGSATPTWENDDD
jgi:hypothetical protein